MSKDIVIQEGGQDKLLGGASKLRTRLRAGGSCDWVLREDIQQNHLRATKNGNYNTDPGYGQVEVDVPQTVEHNDYEIGDDGGDPPGTNPKWAHWVGTLREFMALEYYDADTIYFVVPYTSDP